MSDTVRDSSTFDKLPRLVFLGASGGTAIFTLRLALAGEQSAAIVGLSSALLMWVCWFVLFSVETGRAGTFKRVISGE